MVRKNIFCHLKPEPGHLCQDSSLLCHSIFQNDIETADPVSCHHDQIVAVVIDLADFSFFYRFHLLYLAFILDLLLYYNRINKLAGIDNSIFNFFYCIMDLDQRIQKKFCSLDVLLLLFAGDFPLNRNVPVIPDFLKFCDECGIVHSALSQRNFLPQIVSICGI